MSWKASTHLSLSDYSLKHDRKEKKHHNYIMSGVSIAHCRNANVFFHLLEFMAPIYALVEIRFIFYLLHSINEALK